MFNNSETYGPNEGPNNMVASTNRSQSSSGNVNHNLNSFGKIVQQASSSASGHYEPHNFANIGTPPLGVPPFLPRFQGYETMGHSSSYLPQNPSFLLENVLQDYFPAVSTTTQMEHHNNMLNLHQNFNLKTLNDIPPTSSKEGATMKNNPLSIPYIPTSIYSRSSSIDNYSKKNPSQKSPTYISSSQPTVLKNFGDTIKSEEESPQFLNQSSRTSLENICNKILENIPRAQPILDQDDSEGPTNLSQTTPEYKPEISTPVIQHTSINDKDVTSQSVYNYSNASSPSNKYISERKRKSLEKTVRLIESILVKSNNNLKSDSAESTIEDPLAFSPKAKSQTDIEVEKEDSDDEVLVNKIPKKKKKRTPVKRISPSKKIQSTRRSHVIEIETEVQFEHRMQSEQDCVKIKNEHSSWPDRDYKNPFRRDSNGVPKSDVGEVKIINMENSVEEALATIQNGSSSIAYFECPHCCLLLLHPKRFLIHTRWHKFGLLNDQRAQLVKERVDRTMEKRERRVMRRLSELEATGVENEKNFPCKECDKFFVTKNGLRIHKRRSHTPEVKECRICLLPVASMKALRAHMTCHEDKDAGAYQCPRCPKRFKYRHSLAKHADTHLEKTHGCQECSKMFGSPLLVRLHMKTHERMAKGTSYHCSYCGKGFYEPYNLNVHERTHRNDKPYKCDICESCFVTNSSLKRHLKVSHSALKPHKCAVCRKCFSTEAIRDRHVLRVHADQRLFPHPCDECPRRYMKPKDLKNHVYKMHGKDKKRIAITEADSMSS